MLETANNANSPCCLDNAQYQTLKAEYRRYSLECEAAMEVLLARIKNLQRGMEASDGRDLIDTVTYRVKTFDSCIGKMIRDGKPLTAEGLRQIRDVAGIRVITPFEDDIYVLTDALQNQTGLFVSRIKDYVDEPENPKYEKYSSNPSWQRNGPKDNGYASLHMTICVEVFFLGNKVTVPVEVQIRDKTMDAWAAIEHICGYNRQKGYKCTGKKSPKALELFKKLASYLRDFRSTAIELRDFGENEDE